MRNTMALEEQKKAEDKGELIVLEEENTMLRNRIAELEGQLLAIKKCFAGLKSVCDGAETRIEDILAQKSGIELNVTTAEGRVGWK